MAKDFTYCLVVAAALSDAQGRWLLHCRPAGKDHAGLWEFPGGKVEVGESPRAALVRELEEEAGIILDPEDLEEVGFATSVEREERRSGIVILLYKASRWAGTIEAREGGTFSWLTREESESLPKPPLDVVLAGQLWEKSD